MITKLFEIRDRMTFIPVIAIRLTPEGVGSTEAYTAERYLIRRAGWDLQRPAVAVARLQSPADLQVESYLWDNQRTMGTAHRHIAQHWDSLSTGDVIDVEHVLGEVEKPKLSERKER